MATRTDLAVESEGNLNENIDGVEKREIYVDGIGVITIDIKNENVAKSMGLKIGRYVTIQANSMFMPENIANIKKILTNQLKIFLEDKKSVFVVGLGNRNITPDMLGPSVVDKIVATRHIFGKMEKILGYENLKIVSAIAPGVLGQTGIETTEIVKSILNFIKPDLVLVVDALAARGFERLGSTIQITNTGISPGSGVENKRKELSKDVLGVPVLMVGVPTVVDMYDVAKNNEEIYNKALMLMTPKNVDLVVKRSSFIISDSINKALFPQIPEKELQILAG